MRNKFSELIDAGVAEFKYNNIVSNIQDPLCIEYNNLYSISTDTHMSTYEDGYIITGHMRGDDFDKMLTMCGAGINSGYYSIGHFLSKKKLTGGYSEVNGDRVYILKPCSNGECFNGCSCDNCCCPAAYCESNSKIPRPIKELSINGDPHKVVECFNGNINQVVENLNKSPYVNGFYYQYNNKIYGVIGRKYIVLS